MVAVSAARVFIGRYKRYSATKQGRRQSGSVYVVRLQARPGTDGIRALRATLKALWRWHRMRCLDARELPSVDKSLRRSDAQVPRRHCLK